MGEKGDQIKNMGGNDDQLAPADESSLKLPVFKLEPDTSNPFIRFVERNMLRKEQTGVEREIIEFSQISEKDKFISSYIANLEALGKGIFTKYKLQHGSEQYRCERCNKQTGKKKNKTSTETRANSCSAYVSFQCLEVKGKHAMVIRKKLQHNGHDPNDINEHVVSKIDAGLVRYIKTMSDQGMKPSKILVECRNWCKANGHVDFRQRRFFPKPVDVKNIVASHKARKRHHSQDSVADNILCSDSDMADRIVFNQKLENHSAQSTPRPDYGMLYDFRSIENLHNWWESSDTARLPGKSKAVFELQKTRFFQRAVFFVLLNPQPNWAGFAGYNTMDMWDLTGYHGLEMQARRQGAISHYKMVLRDRGLGPDETYSYEYIFKMPDNEFVTVTMPFSDFKPYYRGQLVPDAPPLQISNVTSVGFQAFGGVYSDFMQSGPGTLEIDYLRAV